MGTRGQGTLPRIFCCRAGDETVEVELEEQQEKRSVGSLSSSGRHDLWVSTKCLLELEARNKQ